MKKATILLAFAFIFYSANSQEEIGYRTTDVGAQFQYYPSGTISSLHFAFNARMNHSILVQIGYNKVNRKDDGEKDNEKGGGWGGGIGYRYYFNPFPHKFFIGVKADIYRMNIDWVQGIQVGETKTWTIQPTLELGYTIIINDQGFITPFIASGAQINMKTDGDKVGQGFLPLFGISAGFRL
jgi:hypothetical protein